MFEAHLSDPVHGEATKQAPTAEEAVELAFRELARSWSHPDDLAKWLADTPMFDGDLRQIGNTDVWGVWWTNRLDVLLGTVHEIKPDTKTFVWRCGGSDNANLIQATDWYQAFRIAIANRLRSDRPDPANATPEEVANQVRWFEHHDQLHEIDGTVNDLPYAGPIPKEVDGPKEV